MCISPEQVRQKEEARKESMEKSYNVCADGKKHTGEYDHMSNEVNDPGMKL